MRFDITTYITASPGQRHFRTGWLTDSGTRSHCQLVPPISCSTLTATGMTLPLIFRDCALEIEQWGRDKANPLQALLGNKPKDPNRHLTYRNGPLGVLEWPTVICKENSSLKWKHIRQLGRNVQKVDYRWGNIKCTSVYSRYQLEFHGAVITVNCDILLLSSFHLEANELVYLRMNLRRQC